MLRLRLRKSKTAVLLRWKWSAFWSGILRYRADDSAVSITGRKVKEKLRLVSTATSALWCNLFRVYFGFVLTTRVKRNLEGRCVVVRAASGKSHRRRGFCFCFCVGPVDRTAWPCAHKRLNAPASCNGHTDAYMYLIPYAYSNICVPACKWLSRTCAQLPCEFLWSTRWLPSPEVCFVCRRLFPAKPAPAADFRWVRPD